MNRRDLITGGLCMAVAGIACKHGTASNTASAPMAPLTRTFPASLATLWSKHYRYSLHKLHILLERLGKPLTLKLWERAISEADVAYTHQILESGWTPEVGDELDVEAMLAEHFPGATQGVTPAAARALVERDPFIATAMELHPTLAVKKDITAYEAVHLRLGADGCLYDAMLDELNQEGILVAYDITRRWVERHSKPMSTEHLLKAWASETDPDPPTMFSAGLKADRVELKETELEIRITSCEWARYFRERHPRVGHLVACSTDEANIRAANPKLRMQRTGTLMEGAPMCDFRLYEV